MTPPGCRLVVVNAAKWPEDITAIGIYSCPCKERSFDRSYFHYPARYLGVYVNKGVPFVTEVVACVRLNASSTDEVLWQFGEAKSETLTNLARERLAATGYHNRPPCLVFVLANQLRTNFVYDGDKGMWRSCAYFDISALNVEGIHMLAETLKGQTWSLLPKWSRKS